MEFTGERYVPSVDRPELAYTHWHRYLYASAWAFDKTILDIGCGEGYGSALLARTATRVVGLDLDRETIAYAAANYLQPNLSFICGAAESIPIPDDGSFDVVVSFETIEHLDLEQQDAFGSEVKRLLKPGGVFLVSTPDRLAYNAGQQQGNPFHRHELAVDEFLAYLRGYFPYVFLLAQKVYPISYVWPLTGETNSFSEHQITYDDGKYGPVVDESKDVRYVIAVCSDTDLNPPARSMLIDISERATQHRLQKLAQLEAALRENDDRALNTLARIEHQLGALQSNLTADGQQHQALKRAIEAQTKSQARLIERIDAKQRHFADRENQLLEQLRQTKEERAREQERLQSELAAAVAAAEEERRQRLGVDQEREGLQRSLASALQIANEEKQQREAAARQLAAASAAAADEHRGREVLERERDRLRGELDARRGVANAERRRRETLERDRERLQNELATHLDREEQLRQRQAESAHDIMQIGRRLAEVDAQLARLRERSRREPPPEVESAQLELMKARQELSALRWQLEYRVDPPPSDPTSADPNGHPRCDLSDRTGLPLVPLFSQDPTSRNGAMNDRRQTAGVVAADIVICIHNALDDVKRCLASVVRYTDARHRVILVDDGSNDEITSYLATFMAAHPRYTFIRNERARGYTRAANQGLRVASAELVVLLNSDTIVTPLWLERIIECGLSSPEIGIVGPLSNAATYQSVPEVVAPGGDWALNPLPVGWEPAQVAEVVASISRRAFPRVPFLNGFCFAMKRSVIDAIGYLDEERFPEGYGEENDYCLRATAAGFDLAVADHAYVFHAKSKSFSHERRRSLSRAGSAALREKHDRALITAGEGILRAEPTLAALRAELSTHLRETSPLPRSLSLLFVLPVSGGGGGAHSVVQEAHGMRQFGMQAQVAVRSKHVAQYREQYAAMPDVDDLFFGFHGEADLIRHAAGFDVIAATIYTSMPLIASIVARNSNVIPAYYVQDYEPWFFAEGSPQRVEAAASYTSIPGIVLFAKTQWLCDTVRDRHDVEVHKVRPSLDRGVYFPPGVRDARDWPVRVAAMIRPTTPRRGAARTMHVLRQLKEQFGRRVEVHIFGCRQSEMMGYGLRQDFELTNHGLLVREQVAQVLREADVFLDLSDYQAFGRTGLEAMACGCAVVLPAAGGSGEYAIHRENALIVDTVSEDSCYAAAHELVANADLRRSLQEAAVVKADAYSIHRAVLSEIALFTTIRSAREQLVGGKV